MSNDLIGKTVDRYEETNKEVVIYFNDGTRAIISNESEYINHKIKLKLDVSN